MIILKSNYVRQNYSYFRVAFEAEIWMASHLIGYFSPEMGNVRSQAQLGRKFELRHAQTETSTSLNSLQLLGTLAIFTNLKLRK